MLVLGSRKRIVDLISIKNAIQRNFIWLVNCTIINFTNLRQLEIFVIITKEILSDT